MYNYKIFQSRIIALIMKKDDLKSLLAQMYDNLLQEIDKQEDTTKEQVVNYIKDVVDIISNIDEENINSIEHEKVLLFNAYKEISDKSLSSYENTNQRFKTLTQMHEKTIHECYQEHIDVASISDKFNEIQTHMVEEVKKANSIISELSKQVKILETATNIDPLTKVFNRRALATYLDKVCSVNDKAYDMHLLILDIDDFKIINDKYGHIAGDKILIFIANILRKTLRDGDKIFRYGGEEFIIVLNRINDLKCKDITCRLLNLIRKNRLIYKGASLNVTMSIGTTKLQADDTPDSLIERADKALYKAKNNGKNQIYSEV